MPSGDEGIERRAAGSGGLVARGAAVATILAAGLVYWQFATDETPAQVADIVGAIDRLTAAIEGGALTGLSPADADAIVARAQTLATAAERAAAAPMEPDAAIFRVGQGVFDLPRNEAYELATAGGDVVPVALRVYANGQRLIVGGKERRWSVGRAIDLPPPADGCSLLAVKMLEGRSKARLRFSCSSAAGHGS